MKKYIFDTNTISYLWDNTSEFHSKIFEKVSSLSEDISIGLSMISFYEMKFGIENSNNEEDRKLFTIALETIQIDPAFNIYNLDYKGADFFSFLKAQYKNNTGISKKANKQNDLDFIVASTALCENAIVVSNDKIFKKLAELEPRLQVENWLEE